MKFGKMWIHLNSDDFAAFIVVIIAFHNLRETSIVVNLWRLCVTGLVFSFQAPGEGEAGAQEGESMEAE